MYGALGSLLLKASPHVLKHGAALTGATAVAGLGMQHLGGQGKLDQMYKDSLEYDQTTGTYKPRGVGAAILKNFVEEEGPEGLEAQKQKAFLEKYIVDSGGSLTDFEGEFDGQTSKRKIDSLLRDHIKAEKKAEKDEDYRRSMELPYMQMQQAREDRLATLDFQRMQMQREDQRYNERLDREERNRRQEAVMAMMGGLTSLGAAFAM